MLGIAETPRELKKLARRSGKVLPLMRQTPVDWWVTGEPGAPPRAAPSAGHAALQALRAVSVSAELNSRSSAFQNRRSAKLGRETKGRKKPDAVSLEVAEKEAGGPGKERGSKFYIP